MWECGVSTQAKFGVHCTPLNPAQTGRPRALIPAPAVARAKRQAPTSHLDPPRAKAAATYQAVPSAASQVFVEQSRFLSLQKSADALQPALAPLLNKAIGVIQSFLVSEGTTETYAPYWKDFSESFCPAMGLDPLPAAPAAVMAYLATILERGLSASDFNNRFYAIQHHHHLQGLDDMDIPTLDPVLVSFRKAAERLLGREPRNRKEPLPLETMLVLWRTLSEPGTSLPFLTLAMASALAFLGLRRISEVLRLRFSDLDAPATDTAPITFRLYKTKNNILRLLQTVHVAPGSTEGFPLAASLRRYLVQRRAVAAAGPTDPLFLAWPSLHLDFSTPATAYSGPEAPAKGLDYGQFRYWLLRGAAHFLAKPFDDVKKQYGTHSLRRGGATAMEAAGQDRAQIQSLGKWKDPASFALYLQPSAATHAPLSASLIGVAGAAGAARTANPGPSDPGPSSPCPSALSAELPADLEFFEDVDHACDTCHVTSFKRSGPFVMVLCDNAGCALGRHKGCFVPPISRVPRGKFFCYPRCQDASTAQAAGGRLA